ncbi:glycerol-3-phosphate 1-O-acyltransferase PlsY [Tianweitania sediminis]|uniref:Glycerol-3-phosphate acyltransferase n=2 Tax=Tianweitania sediminis TaxID=1502156 RepID=A0A8J7UK58_9HYPH|nr:glycerol-3-phosphate 1-O-acyltransferase PlsY [Tianweitania sediminis]
MPMLLGALIFGYLLGSIPSGVLITRAAGVGDVRAIGSGNIGATNVLRTGRKGLAALTLIGDALKGALAVWIVGRFASDAALLAGLGAFLGHLYPVWLKFKGGKGVATYLGVLIAVAFPGALVFALVWIAVAVITRYSSLAALIAAVAVPIALAFYGDMRAAQLFTLLSILVLIKHRANISRLMSGQESKIGSKG